MQSTLMRDIIAKMLPSGYPSDTDLLNMTDEQKEELYEKQKMIIHLFREQSREIITQFQEQINHIVEKEKIYDEKLAQSTDSLLEPAKSSNRLEKFIKKPIIVRPPVFSNRPKRPIRHIIADTKETAKHETIETRPRFVN